MNITVRSILGSGAVALFALPINTATAQTLTDQATLPKFEIAVEAGLGLPVGSFARDEILPTIILPESNVPRRGVVGLRRSEGAYALPGPRLGLGATYWPHRIIGFTLRADGHRNETRVDGLENYFAQLENVRADLTMAPYQVQSASGGINLRFSLPRHIALQASVTGGVAQMRFPSYSILYYYTSTPIEGRNFLDQPKHLIAPAWSARVSADAPVGPLRIGFFAGLQRANFEYQVLLRSVGSGGWAITEDTIRWNVVDLGLRLAYPFGR